MKNHLTLETDGRVDLLTGLDAPEVFYKLLEKSIALAKRDTRINVSLIRFRLTRSDGQPLFQKAVADELEDAGSGPGNAASGPGNAASGPGNAASGPGNAASGPGNAASGPGNAASELRNSESLEAQSEEFLVRANELAFSVAKVGKRLTDLVRSDENVARLGEVTFVLVARVEKEENLEGLLRRFESSLSQLDLACGSERLSVEIECFTHQQGETLLDLLERAHV